MEDRATGHVHETRVQANVGTGPPDPGASQNPFLAWAIGVTLDIRHPRKEETRDEESWQIWGTFAFLGNNDCKRRKWICFKTSTRTLGVKSVSK